MVEIRALQSYPVFLGLNLHHVHKIVHEIVHKIVHKIVHEMVCEVVQETAQGDNIREEVIISRFIKRAG